MKTLVTLIGSVQFDPQLRYTPTGRAILNIQVAGTQGKKPWFHQATVFGAFAEAIAERLKAGTIVAIQGELVQRRWTSEEGETRSALNIIVEGLRVISSKGHDLIEDAGGGLRLAGGINRVSGYGNLVKSPVLRTTQSGIAVANATVAVNRVYVAAGERKEVSYFDLTAWEEAAKTLASLPKGTGVYFEGVLENDSFEGRNGKRYVTRINVTYLLPAEKKLAAQTAQKASAGELPVEEDLPF